MRLLGLLSLCLGAWALHESDVGIVDWHKSLIGIPLSTPAPSFHRLHNSSVILAATANNVLAALEPANGSILWRHVFDVEDRIAGYYKSDNVVATLSGPGGAYLRTFDIHSGMLLLEKRLHAPELGSLSEPLHFGKHVVFSPTHLYALTNGCVVTAVDVKSGEIAWTWVAEDHGSLIINTKIVVTPNTVYLIGLAKSTASFTLHITALETATGKLINSAHVASEIKNPLTQLTLLTRQDLARPVVLWSESGALRYVGLTETFKEKAKPVRGAGFVDLHDVGLSSHGMVVVGRKDGSTFVLKLEGEEITQKSVKEFENSYPTLDNAPSLYIGSIDASDSPYVGQIYWSHKHQRTLVDVYAGAHTSRGFGVPANFGFAFETKKHGVIFSAAIDSAEHEDGKVIKTKILLVTSTGSIQLWEWDGQTEKLAWVREEALSGIAAAEHVEVAPPSQQIIGGGEQEGETFIQRVTRQIGDAKGLPAYIVNFASRFVGGSPKTVVVSEEDKAKAKDQPFARDPFGFRQIIVTATHYGKIFGLDSSTGEIVWSQLLDVGWAEDVRDSIGTITPLKLFTLKTVGDVGNESPEVVIVAQRRAGNGQVDTVVFHIDALTGRDVTGHSREEGVLEGKEVVPGPVVEAFFWSYQDVKVAVLVDEYLQIHLYPETEQTKKAFHSQSAPTLSFPLRTTIENVRRVTGHQIASPITEIDTDRAGSSSSDATGGETEIERKAVAFPTWSLSLPEGEQIQKIVPPSIPPSGPLYVPVASLGKVLGNRTTLYKYLNPRMFIVLTATPTEAKCGLYVVDAGKGSIIYHVELPAQRGLKGCDVHVGLVENWLVYHYFDGELGGGSRSANETKGYRIVSVEFYEGKKADDKIKSSELSPSSNSSLDIQTYQRAFIFPHAISSLAFTRTRFGITTKDLIVATKQDRRVHYIPRRLLDPRRTKGKPSAAEVEEFLVQYEPWLKVDGRRVVSHGYDVASVQKIITSPALLESTSLVFAYGLDLFATRLAPSGTFDVLSESFNKVQLVFTVVGLVSAILVTRPMVRRKRLREKWYY